MHPGFDFPSGTSAQTRIAPSLQTHTLKREKIRFFKIFETKVQHNDAVIITFCKVSDLLRFNIGRCRPFVYKKSNLSLSETGNIQSFIRPFKGACFKIMTPLDPI